MGTFGAGLKSTMNGMARPKRITADIKPGNPVQGLKSLTGSPETATFGRPLSAFGTRGRQALKARSHAVMPKPGMSVR